MHSWRITDFTLESMVSTRKMLSAAKQRAGFLAPLQRSLDCASPSLQYTKERYNRDFDRRLCKGCERIRTNNCVFIELSNGVAKTPKLGMQSKDLLECGAGATHRSHLVEEAG